MGMDIKQVRLKLKLTQVSLAERLGVDPLTVRRWEKGVSAPSRMAQRLIDEFLKENTRV